MQSRGNPHLHAAGSFQQPAEGQLVDPDQQEPLMGRLSARPAEGVRWPPADAAGQEASMCPAGSCEGAPFANYKETAADACTEEAQSVPAFPRQASLLHGAESGAVPALSIIQGLPVHHPFHDGAGTPANDPHPWRRGGREVLHLTQCIMLPTLRSTHVSCTERFRLRALNPDDQGLSSMQEHGPPAVHDAHNKAHGMGDEHHDRGLPAQGSTLDPWQGMPRFRLLCNAPGLPRASCVLLAALCMC
jgi:hypothetical protein